MNSRTIVSRTTVAGLCKQTTTQCKNFKIAYEFLSKNQWPGKLADQRFDRCYCEACYPKNLADTCIVGGRVYVVPRGFTRIGVHIDEAFADHHDIWDTWCNCYHGTSIQSAISVIENRGLLLPGDESMHGQTIKIRTGHAPGQNFFFTTPTIQYASLPQYASSYEFKSAIDGKSYSIKVVLQLKQKPGSFIIQKETVCRGTVRICPYIKNEEIEWKTKKRSTIVTYGVLLLIKEVGKFADKCVIEKLMRPLVSTRKDCVNPREKEGVVLTCEAKNCRAKLQPLHCSHCGITSTYCDCDSRLKNERSIECDKQLLRRQCPYCLVGFGFCKEPQAKQTVYIKCCERRCRKEFSVFKCAHCKNLGNCKR